MSCRSSIRIQYDHEFLIKYIEHLFVSSKIARDKLIRLQKLLILVIQNPLIIFNIILNNSSLDLP